MDTFLSGFFHNYKDVIKIPLIPKNISVLFRIGLTENLIINGNLFNDINFNLLSISQFVHG